MPAQKIPIGAGLYSQPAVEEEDRHARYDARQRVNESPDHEDNRHHRKRRRASSLSKKGQLGALILHACWTSEAIRSLPLCVNGPCLGQVVDICAHAVSTLAPLNFFEEEKVVLVEKTQLRQYRTAHTKACAQYALRWHRLLIDRGSAEAMRRNQLE